MKYLIFILSLVAASSCFAERKCEYTTKKLSFPNPTSAEVDNIFWQDAEDGYETIKRLYISYKDGSTAVIEHKFCSMYNFQIAYYTKDKESLKQPDQVYRKMKSLFGYASIKDDTLRDAIEVFNKNLVEEEYDYEKEFFTNHDDSNEKSQGAEFQLEYLPIEGPALHEAALFIYMGIGGMH
ncbi:hypothetical protein [Cellvibrio sp. NN19]|uniref:hypothetical protein n=1 Tax=Cellvibrio chitinivorans TaxID=3102792 RepID=UPI002B411A94|nr:hypothetical protein [Cellvibrio sp. NN19]